MTEDKEKHDDWRVVVIGANDAKCRACNQPIERGERAWYLTGRGVQHLECPEVEPAVSER